jgi:hypothetical protein
MENLKCMRIGRQPYLTATQPFLQVRVSHRATEARVEAQCLPNQRSPWTATVQKIIKSPDPRIPEKAEIGIHDGDELYREIQIENA